MQSNLQKNIHVAIIMDGNRRWARGRELPSAAGHAAGADALRSVVEAAAGQGIAMLTVYAFSSDNWRRAPEETVALMGLLRAYLDTQTEDMVSSGVRFSAIGRRDRLTPELVEEIARSEAATGWGDALHLRVAMDYCARDAILEAARRAPPDCTRDRFAALLAGDENVGDVDLLIRTGAEQRLSDFLLWECAYAELYFTTRLWPDFGPADLAMAMQSFRQRERRFGGTSQAA